jgi:hypothetical protein
MSRYLFASVLALLLPSCAQHTFDWDRELRASTSTRPVPQDVLRVTMGGVVYQRIFGQELKQAIVGMWMTDESMGCCSRGERFLSDGTYVRDVHRIGWRSGSYRIDTGEVCTRLDGNLEGYCFALFRDKTGRFLAIDFRNHSGPTRINLFPVARTSL